MNPIEYILECIKTIYSIKHKNGAIRRVNVNIAATTVEEYAMLKDAGIGTYILFQETYHKQSYEKLHPAGPKHDYAWHTEAMDGAGYFLEGMTGVDWLGECEALRKEAEAKAKKAAEAAAASAEDAPSTSEAAPPETPVQESIPQEDELEVVYDFNLYSARHRVCLRVRTPRSNPQIHTIAEIYPIAHWHEREIHEFFGIIFIGHPYLIPLLLPEDAEYHPLLKDYSA